MKNVRTLKQFFWFLVKPVFPFFRDMFLKTNLATVKGHKERQRFNIGFLREEYTKDQLLEHLETLGFHREKMALVDPDEIFGMRKIDPFNPCFQYHLRFYRDREIKGHYEKTPEDFPLDHFNEVGFEARGEEFLQMLGSFVEPARVIALSDLLETPEIPDHRERLLDFVVVHAKESGEDQ